jgi:ribonuclease HI
MTKTSPAIARELERQKQHHLQQQRTERTRELQPRELPLVIVHTDGACSRTRGGWGAVIQSGEHRLELSGHEDETTNNRMELLAPIRALEALTERCNVTVVSDSQYVVKGIDWSAGWQRRGWKLASGDPVKNVDLWQRLLELCAGHRIKFVWVRGHDCDVENERADALATGAVS